MDSSNHSLMDRGIRQGGIFSSPCIKLHDAVKDGRAVAAQRKKLVDSNTKMLVLSQDCDIANPNNKHLELVTLKLKSSPSISVQHVRSYNKLQIPFDKRYFECESDLISQVSKKILGKSKIKSEGKVDNRTLSSIIDWRVGRYERKPFPDNFNQDFLTNYIKKHDNPLGKFLECNRDFIDQMHVFVDPNDNDNAKEYLVSVTALLFDDVDVDKRAEIKSFIKEHVNLLHKANNRLRMIQVDGSLVPKEIDIPLDYVMSPDEMTIKEATISRKINLDYLCYTDSQED